MVYSLHCIDHKKTLKSEQNSLGFSDFIIPGKVMLIPGTQTEGT